MPRRLKIGARGSPLSLAQTSLAAEALKAAAGGLDYEIVSIRTTGDKILDAPLAQIGGKGLFVKEIEEALLAGRIDAAVHSAKDLPAQMPAGLCLAAVPERADCRDILISRYPGGLKALPQGARVGTSGLRRQAQLLSLRPDLQITALRGNVATRLAKLESECEATILAAAGLARLGLAPAHATVLEPDLMLPAAGQGTLVLQAREDDKETLALLKLIEHGPSALELAAERGFLRRLGSGCQLPVAALARLAPDALQISGLIASLDGLRLIKDSLRAGPVDIQAAGLLGERLAQNLLEAGGEEIMRQVLS